MPLVTVKAIEQVFTDREKDQIISEITEVLVNIAGEGLRRSTWVVFEEVPSGAWGIGGKPITTQDVKDALA